MFPRVPWAKVIGRHTRKIRVKILSVIRVWHIFTNKMASWANRAGRGAGLGWALMKTITSTFSKTNISKSCWALPQHHQHKGQCSQSSEYVKKLSNSSCLPRKQKKGSLTDMVWIRKCHVPCVVGIRSILGKFFPLYFLFGCEYAQDSQKKVLRPSRLELRGGCEPAVIDAGSWVLSKRWVISLVLYPVFKARSLISAVVLCTPRQLALKLRADFVSHLFCPSMLELHKCATMFGFSSLSALWAGVASIYLLSHPTSLNVGLTERATREIHQVYPEAQRETWRAFPRYRRFRKQCNLSL